MEKDFIPSSRDTKVVLRRIREYSGKWTDVDETMFFRGKPSRDVITDDICRMFSKGGEVIINADFDVCEVTLQDFANHCSYGRA